VIERRQLCLSDIKTTYSERRHIHLPWIGSKNTTYERLERVIQGIFEFYLKILEKLRNDSSSKGEKYGA
jgi:hypothetical protein